MLRRAERRVRLRNRGLERRDAGGGEAIWTFDGRVLGAVFPAGHGWHFSRASQTRRWAKMPTKGRACRRWLAGSRHNYAHAGIDS